MAAHSLYQNPMDIDIRLSRSSRGTYVGSVWVRELEEGKIDCPWEVVCDMLLDETVIAPKSELFEALSKIFKIKAAETRQRAANS